MLRGIAAPPDGASPDRRSPAGGRESGAPGEGGSLRRVWLDVEGTRFHMLTSTGPVPVGPPPLVLVHGLGLSGRYMIPTAERLARHYRVHVPDLPGFGDSARPSAALDIPALADALAAWIRAMGIRPVSLLGNSQGCQIIVDLAARYPDHVARAVLQGPTAPPEDRTWLRQFVRWRQNQPFNPRSMGPSTREDYRKAGYLRILRTFGHALKHHIEGVLPRVEAPILVVRGGLDPICRQEWAEQVANAAPDGRLVVIPGVAHTLVYTSPLELTRVSRPFLDAEA